MKHKFLASKYWTSESTPMAQSSELAKQFDDIINLSLGDPDFITNEKIIAAAFEDARNGHTKYTDVNGDPELINEIIRFYKNAYNYDVEPSEILITVGACHGMFLALQAIINEGDEVIIHEPYFTPYKEQVDLVSGKTIMLETVEEENFHINVNKLIGKIGNNTKSLILNSPNNPTGACFDRKLLEDISKVAVEKDLIIISDEVYDGFSFNKPFIPVTTLPGMKERTITLGSFSKNFAMTGWRVGYAIAPEFIINCMKGINEGVCFTAPSISQRAAFHALTIKAEIQKEIIEEFHKRLQYAYERINSISGLSVLKPQGSIYLFVNIKATGLSSNEISEKLLREAHVLVIPGNSFGRSGEGYIRIACTVGIDKLKEAFDRIELIFNKV